MILKDLLGLASKKMLNINFQTEFLNWGTNDSFRDFENDCPMKIFSRRANLIRTINDSIYDNEDDRHMKIFRMNRARKKT